MSRPLVSVIIPSYNCEAYIAETLRGVLSQTHKHVEVIVVDDGSTDRTTEIVASFGAPVRLITQANQRVCRARNRGIESARGAFLCILDHDDYWAPDKLELQLDALERRPEADIAYSNFILWHPGADGSYPDPESLFPSTPNSAIDDEFSGWIYHHFLIDCWMLTSTALFRREAFTTSGTFDERLPYSEDWDLWLRMSRKHQFVKLRYPTTLYRQHPKQGNRITRPIDYRTELLEKAVREWGLSSPDGRAVPSRTFHDNLARYHREFGLSHLQAGHRATGIRALFKAWRHKPAHARSVALLLAACAGWTPEKY